MVHAMRWVLASTLAACGAAINPADKLMEEHELAYRPELVSILPVYENPDFQGGDDTDEVEPRSNPEIELERATARAQQMGGISISNEGEITVDSRAQYEYLLTQANKKVAATMHELDLVLPRHNDAEPEQQGAAEGAEEGTRGTWLVDADRSQADDEVIDEDGNVVEPSKEGLLDAKLELTAQAYVAYYRNLSLELGAALLGAVALCVCVVVSGLVQPTGWVRKIWMRLPAALSAALGRPLDAIPVDRAIADQLTQARRRVEGAYKSLGQSAAELTGMRSPYR